MPSSFPSRVLQWSPGWDVKNPSTMVLSHPKLMNHINPTLAHLHWRPVESRNFYKSFSSPKNAFMPLASSSTHQISITTIACPEICGPPPPPPPPPPHPPPPQPPNPYLPPLLSAPTCRVLGTEPSLWQPHPLELSPGKDLQHCILWNRKKKKTIENLPIYQRRWFLVNFCQPRQSAIIIIIFCSCINLICMRTVKGP